MKNSQWKIVLLGLVLFSSFSFISFRWNANPTKKVAESTDIKVPAGFVVQVLASDLGPTRHMTISKNGDIYAKLSKLKEGKGIYLLRDTNKDGVIDETKLFGNYTGTGIVINKGFLYASSNKGI